MSEKKKYSLLTGVDIDNGLKNDRFKQENISLIRDKEGRIVRHLPTTTVENGIIPPSIIQINSTYIYQADIGPVIDAIIQTRNIEIFQDLSERHQVVIDGLTYYRDHKSRLDELNSKSLEASSVFEKRIEVYIGGIDKNDLNKTDVERCIAMLDSYLNIIFVYLISTYWIHDKKVSNDTIAGRKISDLERHVRNIYEQLLAESTVGQEKNNIITMNNSVYANFLLSEKNGIKEIEKLIKHDSRFNSLADFMEFIQRCFITKADPDWNQNNERFEISIFLNASKILINKKRDFSRKLFYILEKIDILKNIHSELIKAGEIDLNSIEGNSESGNNKALQFTAIPLALHSGR